MVPAVDAAPAVIPRFQEFTAADFVIRALPHSRESVCGPRAVRMRASRTTLAYFWRRPRVELESRLDSDMPGLLAVSGFGQTRH